MPEASQGTADGTPYTSRWSTGNTKKITQGDRVFLLKQGEEPRGIIAANGLLLRADLHTLLDLDLLGIEPGTLIVRVHPVAKSAGYGGFDGLPLKCASAKPSDEALTLRWESFLRRNR